MTKPVRPATTRAQAVTAAAAILVSACTALVAGPVAAQDTPEPVPCPTTTTTTTLPPREALAVADLPPVGAGVTTEEDCVPAETEPVEDTTTTIATTTTAPRQVIAVDDRVTAIEAQPFESFDVTDNDTISPSLARLEILSGRMPAGLTLWDSGALRGWIIGTPEECGQFAVEYRIEGTANGGERPSDTATVEIEVFCQDAPLPVAVSDDDVTGRSGQRIEVDVVANDQPSVAVAWIELQSGELPAGLTLWAGGWLTGTTTEVGRYTATYVANGANGATGTATVTITIE